jgi:hypothetical protein
VSAISPPERVGQFIQDHRKASGRPRMDDRGLRIAV